MDAKTKDRLVRGMRLAGWTSLADLKAGVTRANKAMMDDARKESVREGYGRFLTFRGLEIICDDAHGRIDDIEPMYNAALTLGNLAIMAQEPGTTSLWLVSGLDRAESPEAKGYGDYDPQVALWEDVAWIDPDQPAEAILKDLATVGDALVDGTAFRTFQDLLDAAGGYRPTLKIDYPDLARLAVVYDEAQRLRGDPRRAYTYSTKPVRWDVAE